MKKSIFVTIENGEAERIEIDANDRVPDLAKLLASRGVDVEGLAFFQEDEDEPVSDKDLLASVAHPVFHAHRCRKIEVEVHYTTESFQRSFAPSATIAKVKRWAVKQAGLGKEEAEEHVLQASGTKEQPGPNQHVGKFASGKCSAAFDLVRKKLVQG